MENFEKLSKCSIISIFIIGGILCLIVLIYWNHQSSDAKQKSLNMEFDGKVGEVDYDIKEIPNVIVDNKTFYLGAGYQFDHQIQQGDSLIKKKESNIIKLIKFKSGKILEFVN